MKIRIKETEHKAFTLVLPNFLFTPPPQENG